MKKNIQTFFLFSWVLMMSIGAVGQQSDSIDHDIKVVVKMQEGVNYLRWGFPSPLSWHSALKNGVDIYRIELDKSGSKSTKITTVLPMSTSDIEALATQHPKSHDLLALVNQQVHLEWENSLYSGKKDILQTADNFNNRWSLVHFAADKDRNAAIAAGLRYEDSEIDPSKKYAYRVSVKGKYPSQQLKSVFPSYSQVPLIFDIEEREKELLIKWDREAHDLRYTSYFIERSLDGRQFERLNSLPYVQMFEGRIGKEATYFTYKLEAENNKKYQYRLIGLDAFGDESKPSPIYIAAGQDRTPPSKPKMKFIKNKKHLIIGLEWEQKSPEDVERYLLERDMNGGKVIIDDFAKPRERSKSFSVDRKGIHSMRLIALDKNGNAAYSDIYFADAVDTKVPDSPLGLEAACDTNGIVTLTWDHPTENDVVGYFIFSSDSETRTYQGLNGISHPLTIFKDTLSMDMMNEEKLYKIVAIDSDGMRSKFSNAITVKIPDLIPPSPALFGGYKVETKYIQLELRPSSSRDVVTHIIERKDNDQEWQIIYKGQPDRPMFQDTMIQSEQKYSYKFYAVDDAGLKSKVVDILNVRSKRKNDFDLSFMAELVDGKVVFTWSTRTKFDKLFLYKKVNTGEIVKTRIKDLSTNYIDTKIKEGTNLSYRIQGILEDGRRTQISKPIEIKVL